MRAGACRPDADVMVLFVAALLAALPAPAIRLVPAVAHPGAPVAIVGTGWSAGTAVELLAGPPHSEADRFATARADAHGAFRKPTRLAKNAVPGSYVFVACQRQCRLKATAVLHIVRR